MTMLLEQGISMHVMMPLEMRLKGTTTKLTSKMFGFSKDSVITASALDKDLRRQLTSQRSGQHPCSRVRWCCVRPQQVEESQENIGSSPTERSQRSGQHPCSR